MDNQERQFMPHVSAEDRLKIMNDNFDRISEDYTKILTEEELTGYRKELDGLVTEIDIMEDELKAYTKPKKDEIKQKKSTRKKLSEITRFGQEDLTAELFIMKDFTQGMAYLRDDNGMLVKVRPLTTGERQGNLY